MQYDPSPTRGDGRAQNSDISSFEVAHVTPFHQYPGLETNVEVQRISVPLVDVKCLFTPSSIN